MILQALSNYYKRKSESSGDVAPEGFEQKEIPFIIVINELGEFQMLEDTRNTGPKGKKDKGRTFLVPQALGRSGQKSHEVSNLLWDHYGYVLAHPKEVEKIAQKTDEQISIEIEKNQSLADKQHESFINKLLEIQNSIPDDPGLKAVLNFLKKPDEIEKVKHSDNWTECLKIKGCNLSFRLASEPSALICQSKKIQNFQKKPTETDEQSLGICLVTGEKTSIARLHSPIKGVNAKPSPFSSVNLPAFESYDKKQGFLFPVSEKVMFEYTTALNILLTNDNRFKLGEVTTVCWADKPTPFESSLSILLNGSPKDNPDAHINEVKNLYKNIHNGKYLEPNAEDKFYLLGMTPNVTRIVIRFWHVTTVAALAENITQWYEDLKMVRTESSSSPEYMSLPRLFGNLVLEGKLDNLPPNLIASVTQSALNNSPLPISLLQTALRRNKAEQKVTYGRASLIKAYLNRAVRSGSLKNLQELPMSLNKERTEIGYVLGRLFAVLEEIQRSANPGLNSTIGDRYFGSASSTPIAVYGTLIRLSKHHLDKTGKQNPGRRVNLEKLLQEIISKVDSFPQHLNINEQGAFAIGYYHQKQDFFIKPTNELTTEKE